MKRTNTIHIREALQDFYQANPHIMQKVMNARILRAWDELLGPMIAQSTQKLFIKNRVLHVSINSSVLRSELLLNRKRLLDKLNGYAGGEVIEDIVIR
jgi:predicted nucleic acid-binding Zn ribbon protein